MDEILEYINDYLLDSMGICQTWFNSVYGVYSVYVCDVFQRHKGFIIIVFERQISILELYNHYNCYKPRKLICSWWGMTKRSDQQF